jgi:hypothetical protein
MTDTKTPPDWALREAAKRCGWGSWSLPVIRAQIPDDEAFTALCDIIAETQHPPVDRKVLCAERAMYEVQTRAAHPTKGTVLYKAQDVALRAIELWEEGYGA